MEQLNNALNSGPNSGGFGVQSQRGGEHNSVQSSPYTSGRGGTSSAYHLQIVNNQMAQLHQLQLDLQHEKEQKELLQLQLQ